MASNVPFVRQISWISLIPHFLTMLILITLFKYFETPYPYALASAFYLLLTYGIRYILTKDHIKGIKLVKSNKFNEAIPCFEKSYQFFSRNSWIDKYRYVTLFSASKMSYKEMALCNIAFCYSQINEGLKAIEYYEKTLQEYPENGLAKAGLKMLNSALLIEKKEE